jgi:hypothetical protein
MMLIYARRGAARTRPLAGITSRATQRPVRRRRKKIVEEPIGPAE